MYRFALRPRWLVGHLAVLLLAATMVALGLWQLRRLDERQAFNRSIRARSGAVVALDAVAAPGQAEVAEQTRFRRVQATGRFDGGHEVLVRFRIRDGLPGYEAVTPLVVREGVAVLVDRGWLPLEAGDRERAPMALPSGEVTVTGLLLRSEGAGRFRPEVRGDGRLVVGAVAVGELERRLGYDLYPGFVQLDGPDDPGGFPEPLPPPDLGEGPHLTYAIQWFSFTAIALGGWALLVRSSARRRRSGSGITAPAP